MRNIVTLMIIVGLAGYGYTRYQAAAHQEADESVSTSESEMLDTDIESASSFKCDGRKHCRQMTSCEEATYFIEHCPDTGMDGDNDGVPCERQWCGGS
jgi:hypothetical protein